MLACDVRELADDVVVRLVPGCLAPLLVAALAGANQRMRQAIRVVNALRGHRDAAQANALVAWIRKRGGLEFDNPVVLHECIDTACAETIGRAHGAYDAIECRD